MKKMMALFLSLILIVVSMAACGGEKSPEITIDDITKAFQQIDSNFAFGTEEKPYFEMVGAEDGWIGYIDETKPVKVYRFSDEKAYKEAAESFDMIKDWPRVGNFVLECNDSGVQEAFAKLGN